MVEYKYDAWGRPIAKTGSLASTLGTLNPFRYRGYVYDEETGLYYLCNRYYTPMVLRFINADPLIHIDSIVLQTNGFAYCCNNPIICQDPSGLSFESIWKDVKNYLRGAAAAELVNRVVGFDHVESPSGFVLDQITVYAITDGEADWHNTAVDRTIGAIAAANSYMIGACLAKLPFIGKHINAWLSGLCGSMISSQIDGDIQSFFADLYTVRAGTYTSILFHYKRDTKLFGVFPVSSYSYYEIRAYHDYYEVWFRCSSWSSYGEIPNYQKVGTMTIIH